MSIFLAMANDAIKSYSLNDVFWFFSTKSKKSLGKRKKVKLCTDTYDWYSCLEYQYIELDARNLMSIFLTMANDAIKSYSWNDVFLFFSTKSKKSLGKKKKVTLRTDTYHWYSCLEYQYIELDERNLMSIFLAMANDPIESYLEMRFFSTKSKKSLGKGKK